MFIDEKMKGMDAAVNNSELNDLYLFIRQLGVIDECFADYLSFNDKKNLLAVLEDPAYEKSLLRKFSAASVADIVGLLRIDDLTELRAKVHPMREITFNSFSRLKKKPAIPQIHFIYVLSGSCRCTIDERSVLLEEGELCLHGPEYPKFYSISEGEDCVTVNCRATVEYMNSILTERLSKNNALAYFFSNYLYGTKHHFIHFRSSASEKLRNLILSAFTEYYSNNVCADEIVKSYMVLIFAELLRTCTLDGGADPPYAMEKTPISDVLCYIADNCTTATLQSTAEHYHFHPNYFCATIKRLSGRTFTELLQEAKLNYACRLLQYSDMPVDAVANHIGYKNISYFYKLFSKRYGNTPAAMREKMKNETLN